MAIPFPINTNRSVRMMWAVCSFSMLAMLLTLMTTMLQPARADTLAASLTSNDHVLLMRHASAPGTGDPPNFSLSDCTTQRNLSDSGKQQATKIGNWLRSQGVQHAVMYSSPWCRCIDTATLLDFGPVTREASLASFFNDRSETDAATAKLQAFVANALLKKNNQPLILVTHEVNITAYVGKFINSGDMVLAKVDRQGKVVSYRVYPSP